MYDGTPPVKRTQAGGAGIVASSGKLFISNLDFGVNDTDIRELFGEFGPLIKATVHYDRSGRSLGTADVIFERRSDASRAQKQCDKMPLNGRLMTISIVGDIQAKQPAGSRLGQRPFLRSGRGSLARCMLGGGRGGRGRGGGRGASNVTKEELDAQLDAYNSKRKKD
jgi:THO complex subunit 4